MLFAPTKFYAIAIIASCNDASPWWYAVLSETYEANLSTFIDDIVFQFLSKVAYIIFIYDILSPQMFGIDLRVS